MAENFMGKQGVGSLDGAVRAAWNLPLLGRPPPRGYFAELQRDYGPSALGAAEYSTPA